MIRSRWFLMALILLMCASMGCAMVERPKSAMRRATRMFTPKPENEGEEDADSDEGEWDFVGDQGRNGQERERDPDRWFKDWVMSDKANSIERNLGID